MHLCDNWELRLGWGPMNGTKKRTKKKTKSRIPEAMPPPADPHELASWVKTVGSAGSRSMSTVFTIQINWMGPFAPHTMAG